MVSEGENTMRASNILKTIMKEKKLKVKDLADLMGKSDRTVYNTFSRDNLSKGGGMTFENVVEYAEALGCEVIIRDKETRKEYR